MPVRTERIKVIEEQLDKLLRELYEEVKPTEDEVQAITDSVEDDAVSAASLLLDKHSWYGRLYLASEALDIRDPMGSHGARP